MTEKSDTPVLDLLASMTEDSIEASSLDAETLMLVRVAALVAVDAPAASYLLNLGAASELEIDAEQVRGVLAWSRRSSARHGLSRRWARWPGARIRARGRGRRGMSPQGAALPRSPRVRRLLRHSICSPSRPARCATVNPQREHANTRIRRWNDSNRTSRSVHSAELVPSAGSVSRLRRPVAAVARSRGADRWPVRDRALLPGLRSQRHGRCRACRSRGRAMPRTCATTPGGETTRPSPRGRVARGPRGPGRKSGGLQRLSELTRAHAEVRTQSWGLKAPRPMSGRPVGRYGSSGTPGSGAG